MVDDEEKFRETTSKILNKYGYETTMAASGEEAVEIISDTRHDVVILDIQMGGMDGLQALKKIKVIQPDISIIMLTGQGNLESAKESLALGADDYLNKPCDIDLLSQKIKAVFSREKDDQGKEEKSARDLMIRADNYTRISAETTVKEAVSVLMKSLDGYIASSRLIYTVHRSMLVYQDRDTLAGILSTRNLIEALRPEYLSAAKPPMADSMQYSSFFWSGLFTDQTQKLGQKPVREIMNEILVRVDGDANLMEIADLMYKHKTRRVIVMENDAVIGVIREQELFFEIANILL